MARTGFGLFMHCTWDGKTGVGKTLPSSTFPLCILIRLLIYLFISLIAGRGWKTEGYLATLHT